MTVRVGARFTRRAWGRIREVPTPFAPLTGLAAVVFTAIGFLLLGNTPRPPVRFYCSDRQARLVTSLYFPALTSTLVALFATYLSRTVRGLPSEGGWLYWVVLVGGVLIAVSFLVGAAFTPALPVPSHKSSVANGTSGAQHRQRVELSRHHPVLPGLTSVWVIIASVLLARRPATE